MCTSAVTHAEVCARSETASAAHAIPADPGISVVRQAQHAAPAAGSVSTHTGTGKDAGRRSDDRAENAIAGHGVTENTPPTRTLESADADAQRSAALMQSVDRDGSRRIRGVNRSFDRRSR